jgi:hypothetical protein
VLVNECGVVTVVDKKKPRIQEGVCEAKTTFVIYVSVIKSEIQVNWNNIEKKSLCSNEQLKTEKRSRKI